MLRDLKTKHAFEVAIDIQAISSDTTTDGNIIDLQGKSGAVFAIHSGVLTDGAYVPLLEESDVITFGGEETAVADADMIGTEALASFTLSEDGVVKTLGYIGEKRFVRLALVSSSTSTGGTIGADVITLLDQTA